MMEPEMPRFLSRRPMEATLIPLPTDDATPPVTKINFDIRTPPRVEPSPSRMRPSSFAQSVSHLLTGRLAPARTAVDARRALSTKHCTAWPDQRIPDATLASPPPQPACSFAGQEPSPGRGAALRLWEPAFTQALPFSSDCGRRGSRPASPLAGCFVRSRAWAGD